MSGICNEPPCRFPSWWSRIFTRIIARGGWIERTFFVLFFCQRFTLCVSGSFIRKKIQMSLHTFYVLACDPDPNVVIFRVNVCFCYISCIWNFNFNNWFALFNLFVDWRVSSRKRNVQWTRNGEWNNSSSFGYSAQKWTFY